jgi:[amino group carrier protein]-lysine/ornithine hydrolase
MNDQPPHNAPAEPASPQQPAVRSAAQIQADVDLLTRMLATPSPSGGEGALADLLVKAMTGLGFDASIDEAGNAVGVIEHPLPGRRSTDIVLLGHMDTVPGEIPVRIEGDELFGRGAVDAKGPLATFVLAAARARIPAGVRLVVAGAVEEEAATSRGARHLAGVYNPAACIIGEPSGWDGVTLGYKGRALIEFMLERDAAHSAGPRPSVADEAAAWWVRVREHAEAMVDADGAFSRVQATLREIRTSSDGLTERAEGRAGFRLPPGVTPQSIESLCQRLAPPGMVLRAAGTELAHVADRANPVSRALITAIRSRAGTPRPKHKTGTSDMNVVGPAWGCPIAAYGPGDSALDHAPDERINLAEFERAIDVLAHALELLAAELADVEGR